MAKTIWKDVQGYEGLYMVSNDGRVKSITRYKKELKPSIGSSGYYYVQLWHDGKCKCRNIHRLVAQAFCENPENKPFVNHLDENKLNNSATNLEWVTHKENCNYGTAIQRRMQHMDYSKRIIDNSNQIESVSKPIKQYTKQGEFIRTWKSASECHRETGIAISSIRRVVSGERNTAGGFFI